MPRPCAMRVCHERVPRMGDLPSFEAVQLPRNIDSTPRMKVRKTTLMLSYVVIFL